MLKIQNCFGKHCGHGTQQARNPQKNCQNLETFLVYLGLKQGQYMRLYPSLDAESSEDSWENSPSGQRAHQKIKNPQKHGWILRAIWETKNLNIENVPKWSQMGRNGLGIGPNEAKWGNRPI